MASSAVAASQVDEIIPINSKAHWQTKFKLSQRKQKLRELGFSHRLPHSMDTHRAVFSSFPPQTRDLKMEGLYPCQCPRYDFIVLQNGSEEPEQRAGGLSMVFLIAA